MTTSIEWTKNADGSEGETWNPIRARNRETGKQGHYCQKISPGCKNCYAESMNCWRGNGVAYSVPGLEQVELYIDAEALLQPLRWRKPRNIFVCSMTDLFADFVPDGWIDLVYAVMRLAFRHTFMILTKRPARRLCYLSTDEREVTIDDSIAGDCDLVFSREQDHAIYDAMVRYDEAHPTSEPGIYEHPWPLPNVREGVSVCTQKEADEHREVILNTPAALRWLSIEPILESIDVSGYISIAWRCSGCRHHFAGGLQRICPNCKREHYWTGSHAFNPRGGQVGSGIDWIVVGGESGTKARATDIRNIAGVVSQCSNAGVPCFVKQVGAVPMEPEADWRGRAAGRLLKARNRNRVPDGFVPLHMGPDAKGGDPAYWPEHLQVQQFPAAQR